MILLPALVRASIERDAEAAYPEECCGLLVGRRRPSGRIAIERKVSSRNVATGGRRDRFEVDPRLRFGLIRELAGTPLVIVGHYHSHPDHPAEPSTTDQAMAFEPDLIWLIVAVGRPRPGEPAQAAAIRAFRIEAEGCIFELPIEGGESARK